MIRTSQARRYRPHQRLFSHQHGPIRPKSDADSALQRLAGGNDFTTIIVATVRAHMVRALQLATVRALGVSLGGQSLMAATHARP
jgi:hypothetical protein